MNKCYKVSAKHDKTSTLLPSLSELDKGHHPSADLRYGEEDCISPSTHIVAAIQG